MKYQKKKQKKINTYIVEPSFTYIFDRLYPYILLTSIIFVLILLMEIIIIIILLRNNKYRIYFFIMNKDKIYMTVHLHKNLYKIHY